MNTSCKEYDMYLVTTNVTASYFTVLTVNSTPFLSASKAKLNTHLNRV